MGFAWLFARGPIGGASAQLLSPHTIDGLPGHQKTVAILLAVSMLLVVIELVRRRKLREEYSLIWASTAAVLLLLAIDQRLLNVFMTAIGAIEPTSALFFGALVFLMLVALQFSVRLSKLSVRNRTLSQRVALLEEELREMRQPSANEARTNPSSEPDSVASSTDEGDAA